MCSCVFSLFCWLSFFFFFFLYFHRWYLHCWFFPASKQQDYVPVREVGSDFLASRRGNCIPTWGCSSCKWIYIYIYIYTKSILYKYIYILLYCIYIYTILYIYTNQLTILLGVQYYPISQLMRVRIPSLYQFY